MHIYLHNHLYEQIRHNETDPSIRYECEIRLSHVDRITRWWQEKKIGGDQETSKIRQSGVELFPERYPFGTKHIEDSTDTYKFFRHQKMKVEKSKIGVKMIAPNIPIIWYGIIFKYKSEDCSLRYLFAGGVKKIQQFHDGTQGMKFPWDCRAKKFFDMSRQDFLGWLVGNFVFAQDIFVWACLFRQFGNTSSVGKKCSKPVVYMCHTSRVWC